MTRPDGLLDWQLPYTANDAPYWEEYISADLTELGCYAFEIGGIGVTDWDYPRYVWNGSPPAGTPIQVHVDADGQATVGGC